MTWDFYLLFSSRRRRREEAALPATGRESRPWLSDVQVSRDSQVGGQGRAAAGGAERPHGFQPALGGVPSGGASDATRGPRPGKPDSSGPSPRACPAASAPPTRRLVLSRPRRTGVFPEDPGCAGVGSRPSPAPSAKGRPAGASPAPQSRMCVWTRPRSGDPSPPGKQRDSPSLDRRQVEVIWE